MLVWCLEDVDWFLFVLPNIEAPIYLKAVPDDGPDDESNGPASFDIMLHLGGNAPPPVLRQEEIGRRGLSHVTVAVVMKLPGGDSDMLARVCTQDPRKQLCQLWFLACGSSELEDPPGERLGDRAQVGITPDKIRENNDVVVISRPEDVDNR